LDGLAVVEGFLRETLFQERRSLTNYWVSRVLPHGSAYLTNKDYLKTEKGPEIDLAAKATSKVFEIAYLSTTTM
jgi:hypothetical protein